MVGGTNEKDEASSSAGLTKVRHDPSASSIISVTDLLKKVKGKINITGSTNGTAKVDIATESLSDAKIKITQLGKNVNRDSET